MSIDVKTEAYYRVRWKRPESKEWVYSWQHHMTEEEAMECLKNDVSYFYDDIEIQMIKCLIKCSEEVIEVKRGSHKRSKT